MIRVAFIVPDNRDTFGRYSEPNPIIGYAPQGLLNGFRDRPDCEIHVISLLKKRAACPPKLASNIYYHGLYIPFGAWFKTLYASAILGIRKKVREIKPDIVHAQGSETFAAIAGALSGHPNIITLHGIVNCVAKFHRAPAFSYLGVTAKMETVAVRRANGVLCLSSHSQAAVKGDARKTWVVPNAVDERYFLAQRTPVSPPEILCVGLVGPLKNQMPLMRALDPLAARLSFKLVFLGKIETESESEFRRMLAERPWCEYIGYLNAEGLKEKMARATMLVHPTNEDNCPMAIIESMAAGLPIAASRVGGIPDLVTDRSTALLFDQRDADAIRVAVETLLTQRDLAERLSAKAREEADQRFRPATIAERHLEIYREVASG